MPAVSSETSHPARDSRSRATAAHASSSAPPLPSPLPSPTPPPSLPLAKRDAKHFATVRSAVRSSLPSLDPHHPPSPPRPDAPTETETPPAWQCCENRFHDRSKSRSRGILLPLLPLLPPLPPAHPPRTVASDAVVNMLLARLHTAKCRINPACAHSENATAVSAPSRLPARLRR